MAQQVGDIAAFDPLLARPPPGVATILVLPDRYGTGWPSDTSDPLKGYTTMSLEEFAYADSRGLHLQLVVSYGHKPPLQAFRPVEAGDAFLRTYTTDAHFAAYESSLPYRLRLETLTAVDDDQHPRMVWLVADVDNRAAHRAELPEAPVDWRAAEHEKLRQLAIHYPGLFAFDTKNGYRIIYRIARRPVLSWRLFYRWTLCYLLRAFGISADLACSDWPRLFRLPRVVRTSGRPAEDRALVGDAHSVGLWSREPADEELVADIEVAQREHRDNPDASERKSWGRMLDELRALLRQFAERDPGRWGETARRLCPSTVRLDGGRVVSSDQAAESLLPRVDHETTGQSVAETPASDVPASEREERALRYLGWAAPAVLGQGGDAQRGPSPLR